MGNEESIQSSPDDSDSEEDFGKLSLTKSQIRQIRKLWEIAQHSGNQEPGRSILLAIISKSPEAARLFNFGEAKNTLVAGRSSPVGISVSPAPSLSPSSRSNSSTDLAGHARRFNAEIGIMIQHLHKPEKAREHFAQLGSRHAAMKLEGFSTKLWDIFADCMIEKTVQWGTRHQRNTASQEAWGKIILFLIDSMKTGYYNEMRKLRRASNLSRASSFRAQSSSSKTHLPDPSSAPGGGRLSRSRPPSTTREQGYRSRENRSSDGFDHLTEHFGQISRSHELLPSSSTDEEYVTARSYM